MTKIKTKLKKKDIEVTRKDILKQIDSDKGLRLFIGMMDHDRYQYLIKRDMYLKGDISPKGMLYNNDILNLPMFKKDTKDGKILVKTYLQKTMNRFLLSNRLAKGGDMLMSFLVDNDEQFSTFMLEKATDSMEDQVVKESNEAFNRLSNTLIQDEVSTFISADARLSDLLIEEQTS